MAKSESAENTENYNFWTDLEKEIETLTNDVNEKKEKYHKTIVIQNLRLFKGIANFVMPFVLIGAVTVGAFAAFGGGLPFVSDEVKKYKKYDISCEESKIVEMKTSFVERHWYSDAIASSEIVLSMPWCFDGSNYKREIITLSVDSVYDEQVVLALLNADAEALKDMLTVTSIVEETSNREKEVGGEILIDANLHQIDKNELLTYPESEIKNFVITLVEAIIAIIVGAFVTYYRDFSIVATVNNIKYQINDARYHYTNANKNLKAKKLILAKKRNYDEK